MTKRLWNRLACAIAATLLFFAAQGCAAFNAVKPYLADMISAAINAGELLDIWQRASDDFFRAYPNPFQQQQTDRLITDARLALAGVMAAARGAEELSPEQAEAAFDKFRQAYLALEELGRRVGIQTPDGRMRAGTATVSIPRPVAMDRVVR